MNIKRKNQMFILCYVSFMIALFLEDMAFKMGNIALIVKAIKAVVMVLLVLSAVGKSWKKKEFGWVVFGVLCGALTLLLTGDFFWLIVILIAYVFYDVGEKIIYNVSLQTIVGMTSLTLVLYALGILSDCLTYRTDFSTEARHTLGFVHSACLPLIVFYMMTYCISINRDKRKIGVLAFIGIVLYIICKSRNAMVITVVLLMLVLLLRNERIKNKIKKPFNLICRWIVFACMVFSILPGYLRYKGILLNYWYMADLLASYAREDSRIKYIVNSSNIGLVGSLNIGLKNAVGEFIARMDADDIATRDRLEKQLEFLKIKNYDLVGCNAIKIDEDGKEIGCLNVPTAFEKIKEYQLYGGCVLHPTWLGKREVFEKLKGYRSVYACEDFDFILRAIQNGFKIGNMPTYGLYYRIRTGSVSSKANIRQKLTMYYLIDNGAYLNVPSVEMLERYLNSVKYKDDFVTLEMYESVKTNMKVNKFNLINIYDFFRIIKNKYFYRNLIERLKMKEREKYVTTRNNIN